MEITVEILAETTKAPAREALTVLRTINLMLQVGPRRISHKTINFSQ